MSRSLHPNPSRPPSSRSRSLLLAWGAVGLVVVIVAVLVMVKIVAGNGPSTSPHQAVRAASAQLIHELSTVPASVFDAVGAGIP
jgi:hypothetical protein